VFNHSASIRGGTVVVARVVGAPSIHRVVVIMAHSNGDLLRVVPTKTAPESLPLGERLRPSKK
jgi:hypothetical protein